MITISRQEINFGVYGRSNHGCEGEKMNEEARGDVEGDGDGEGSGDAVGSYHRKSMV